ncbi:hypothetical protein DSCO28_55650 [Desulfosarcina ovata subsp. sediminis]|uniref:Uncharacterized protein n=1 Tax=Desulfosarcina ovata subsp. sediminis TaxID=885957 RepID=A0A5K7ZXM2_9BACT|nr:hypothetical protein DSCO28_55650 [Desulfosarcina ovata subsp. sediminis]
MHPFQSKDQLCKYLDKYFDGTKSVYNDTGLKVTWHTSVREDKKPGGVLDLQISQIMINGKKPTQIPHSQNDKIIIEYLKR